jgi:Holliday junction DNA helicase RuvA
VIAWLSGTLREKRPPLMLVDVAGVGYEVEAPMSTFAALPELGAEVVLFTHQVVREDAHQLYGFAERTDRDVFRLLLKVNGVGAKLGLTILSGMDSLTLGRCIFEGDTASLARLPGIGKKTADRLVIEMRDRLKPVPGNGSGARGLGATQPPPGTDPIGEAVSALLALGLKPNEASRRVAAVDTTDLACEEIVRQALKAMVK